MSESFILFNLIAAALAGGVTVLALVAALALDVYETISMR
jgi:hypothetical protein